MTKYTDRHQVRTSSGRHIASVPTVERAEHIANNGRERDIYKFIDGRYVYIRTLGSSAAH